MISILPLLSGERRQRRADALRMMLFIGLLCAVIMSVSSCVMAKGDGTKWSLSSVGTDYTNLDLSAAGMKAESINQSTTFNATLKVIKGAWSNYLTAEALKWVAGKYYDHQGSIVSGAKEVDLEKLRNAKSVADSDAALATLNANHAAEAAAAVPVP